MSLRYGAYSQSYKMPQPTAFAPSFKEVVVNSDNTVEERLIPSNSDLPNPEDYSVQRLLDAKIPLNQVNTKVMNPDFGLFLAAADELGEVEDNSTSTQTEEV